MWSGVRNASRALAVPVSAGNRLDCILDLRFAGDVLSRDYTDVRCTMLVECVNKILFISSPASVLAMPVRI